MMIEIGSVTEDWLQIYKRRFTMNDMIRLNDAAEKRSAEKRRRITLAASAGIIAVVCVTAVALNSGSEASETQADLSAYAYVNTEAAQASEAELPETEAESEAAPEEYSVNITADGETVTVLASGTVADALDAADISVGEDDIISIDTDEKLTSDTDVVINRVEFVNETKYRRMKFKTEYVDDDTLPEGETKVITEGKKGRVKVEYLVQTIDGEEVSREIVSKEVVRHSVSEVIANGTYTAPEDEIWSDSDYTDYEESYSEEEPETYSSSDDEYAVMAVSADETDAPAVAAYDDPSAEQSSAEVTSADGTMAADAAQVSQLPVPEDIILDADGIPTSYTQALHGKSCAYTASAGALMSTGKAVDQGYVAVNPSIIPYGSKLWIVADDGEVYGYAIAADTGGSVGRNDILVDLFMWSYDECIQWGAKNVTIYVIE